jgi:hypothetical protein
MKKILTVIFTCMLLTFFLTPQVFAHTPLCSCYDNGDGTITCEGGFSDGSSGAMAAMRVEDKDCKVILKGKMDEDGEFTFDRPKVPYRVLFDAGPGHEVEVKGEDITE